MATPLGAATIPTMNLRIARPPSRPTLALSLAATLLLAGCQSDAQEKYRRLVESHASVDGVVVRADCGGHGRVVYAFVASGVEHRAVAGHGDIRCDAVREGDAVTVYFDPRHPEVNTVLRPEVAYEQSQGSVWAALGAVGGVMLLAIGIARITGGPKRSRLAAGDDQGNVK